MPRRIIALAGALALLAGACRQTAQPEAVPSPEAAFPITLTDDDGAEVTIEEEPQRIVTFAPSHTEVVFALGLGERLVGVSGSFDNHPPEAAEVEQVGGAGEFGVDPNVERVVALEPDLMLAIAGGEHWKEQLRDLDVPLFTLNATDFDDLLGDIETTGRLTGTVDEAGELTASMAQEAAAVEAAAGGRRASCFFEAFFPPLTTVGPNTFIHDLLVRGGCDPISAGAATDYPEWSVEQLVEDDPDVYLVSSESGHSPEAVAARPGFGALTPVQEGRVVPIDSDLIARPGPRVVEGLRAVAEALA